MGIRSLASLGMITAAVAAASPAASAAVLYDSGGFEAPRFTDGPLQGQDPPTNGPWGKDSGTATGIVTTTNAFAGSQAVSITRPAAATGDTRWAVTKPTVPTPGANIFDVDVDMRVNQATFAGTPPTHTDFGPAFGLEAYDFSNVLSPKLLGSLTVDATTGDVLYQQTVTGILAETGTIVSRGAYHHYKLRLDFGSNQYQIFADNTLLRTEPFIDSGATTFTDAPIGTFAATGTSLSTATGTAFFDNYTINVIPEPTGAALAGLAMAALAGRRRGRPGHAGLRA